MAEREQAQLHLRMCTEPLLIILPLVMYASDSAEEPGWGKEACRVHAAPLQHSAMRECHGEQAGAAQHSRAATQVHGRLITFKGMAWPGEAGEKSGQQNGREPGGAHLYAEAPR